jgi:hypothetical protein
MQIKCTQCGAGLDITEDTGFIVCPFCDSRLYLESDRTVRHFYLQPVIKAKDVAGFIGKELSRRELKDPAQVISAHIVFIPFWLVRMKETTLSYQAADLEYSVFEQLKIPVGELIPYESELEGKFEVQAPEVSLEQIMKKQELDEYKDKVERVDLIHIPFYKVRYSYKSAAYHSLVDACSGVAYAENFPASISKEKDRFFMIIFAVLSVVFTVEAFALPGFLFPMLAFVITGAGAWFYVSRLLNRKGY